MTILGWSGIQSHNGNDSTQRLQLPKTQISPGQAGSFELIPANLLHSPQGGFSCRLSDAMPLAVPKQINRGSSSISAVTVIGGGAVATVTKESDVRDARKGL